MSLSRVVVTAFVVSMAIALPGQKEFTKADKLLNLKAYELAIKNYEAGLMKHPDNAEAYVRLAEAYRMTNQLLSALKAYEKAFELSEDLDPRHQAGYAHTLKKVGLYEQAQAWYEKYLTTNASEATYFIASTDYAKTLLQMPDQYDILSFDANSPESDFGVALFKDKIVFASFRDDLQRSNQKKNDSYINQRGNQLYLTYNTGNSGSKEIRFLRSDGKEDAGLGPLSYSDDGTMVAYMKNTFTSACNQITEDEMNISIYLASVHPNGDFSGSRPFEYNRVEYSNAFPHLANNGSALYFSSNKPGGYGGFDIYVSLFREGRWTKPENLGPEINTSGNEISPFFNEDQLYFASDYHMGLGGYDNFVSQIVNGQWAKATNVGKGINSPSDDYYLIPDTENDRYFVTSNRLGGRGKDDIYVAYELVSKEKDIPGAVQLESLVTTGRKDESVPLADAGEMLSKEVEGMDAPGSPAEVILASESDETEFADKVTIEDIYFDFEGATLVSVEETRGRKEDLDKNAEVYFIQLASLSKTKGRLGYYSEIIAYGNLYRFFKPNSVKIRLGYYRTRVEAADVLVKVKNAGFKDAFVTSDILGISEYELLRSGQAPRYDVEQFINEYSTSSQYKVKLASYLNPMSFDLQAAQGIGKLEQWSKGRWTIFVVGGFDSFQAAEAARMRAVNVGFADAELVLDDGGILRRVRTD